MHNRLQPVVCTAAMPAQIAATSDRRHRPRAAWFVQLLVTFCHEKASPYRVKRVRTRCTVLLKIKMRTNCACQHNRRTGATLDTVLRDIRQQKWHPRAAGKNGCAMGVMGLNPMPAARRQACCRLCECAYIALRTYPLPCAMFSVAPASPRRARAQAPCSQTDREEEMRSTRIAVDAFGAIDDVVGSSGRRVAGAGCVQPGPSPRAPMATEAR